MHNTHVYGEAVTEFVVGRRVATHPGTTAFLRGERFGEVVKIGRDVLHVVLDASGRRATFTPGMLAHMAAD
ncbi:hypothetical protein I5G86_gp23 [Mycobacterium phage DarthP]|uniref:Uncharacterized protein n=2 Tax=Amginevirus TaxID=2946794 RepID=A0A222ZNP3_9CAUD|nr:hypothetical protein I5G85_gp23 [Mycobacterium phage Amohnition]YP_009952034.1 hypothetical protein I5G86_gp23 [Mycobacterium phage DarthP]ASR86356.1 hypothetical protein SEA_AMOHNITION_76 [Mycobacterium phage Amohnition]ASW31822.1 hypothetical protein SEA_DARTHP_76 [Mycobacterium phage DarthP]